MIRLLVAGNSQAGSLYEAIASRQFLPGDGLSVSWFIVPGGMGPALDVVDNRLVVLGHDERYPPRILPPETAQARLDSFDVVFVSALGFVDGGFAFASPIVWQGGVAEYGVRNNPKITRLVSQAVMREVVADSLSRHDGFVFLHKLRANYRGRIIVQPFPQLSDAVAERNDWEIGRSYEDALGFSAFLGKCRDGYLEATCRELGVDLLDYPDPAFRTAGFTPRRLMRESDGCHCTGEYGAMVWRQVEALCASQDASVSGSAVTG